MLDDDVGAESVDVDDLADVATRAVEAGGEYLRERFVAGETEAEYTTQDVKTAADRVAEDGVLTVIRDAYPDHAVSAEESGDHSGDGDYRWVVDALDGTNNFAIGVSTFGVAATVCDRGPADGDDSNRSAARSDPVATAVSVPVLDDLYVATRGGGVRYNGSRVHVSDGDTVDPSMASVAKIIGPEVLSGGVEQREWNAVSDAVDAVPKRAIQTWAPVVYWGLFARGKLDGFVCYYPAEREQVAGELLAREAGAVERSDGPLSVFAVDERTRDALWDAATEALEEVDGV